MLISLPQEIGVKGTYQVTQAFLRLVPEGKRGFVCSLGSGIATMVFPGLSSYSIAKLAIARLTEYVAIENPNVIATVYHPGVVDSDMTEEHADFGYFAKDTGECPCACCEGVGGG